MNKFQKRRNNAKAIALERIKELFRQAEINPKYADRYVSLVKKISSRSKAKIPSQFKRRFCRNCGSYFRLGKNARIRLNKGKKTYYCVVCGSFTRVPYK